MQVLILLSLVSSCFAAPVEYIPGFGVWDSNVDAGYLLLNNSSNALFYVLVEADQVSPTSAPIVVWLQGGPCCSSLFGLFNENGPWTVNADLSVSRRGVSWTGKYNVLWIDQPALVGFSFHNKSGSPVLGDKESARETAQFMELFLAKFSHLKGTLFFAGESFAGA